MEVSSATPEHNLMLMRLSSLLHSYVVPKRVGVALPETDLAVRANTRLRPDFGLFSAEIWRTVDVKRVPVVQIPDIAVEILSPSETATTIHRKVDAYLKWGVPEVWLIHPEVRTLFVHSRPGVQRLNEGAFLTSSLVPAASDRRSVRKPLKRSSHTLGWQPRLH
jgi:Uma2 family endonuclease